MRVSVITKSGKQAEITLTQVRNEVKKVTLVTVDGKEIAGDWRLENNLVKNYTNKTAIELTKEVVESIRLENVKVAKVSYSNRYLQLSCNEEGMTELKKVMENTCTKVNEVEQILDGQEMLVTDLIAILNKKTEIYDIIEEVKTEVEYVADNYDEYQDGNFKKVEKKIITKKLVKKEAKKEAKEEAKEETKEETKEEVKEQKAYFNSNSGWYLINGNYKDLEEIEENEIDLTQYEIINLESSECDIDYGFDSFNGVAKCYTWKADDGVWFLEEEGCFTEFGSCEELEYFMNLKEMDF